MTLERAALMVQVTTSSPATRRHAPRVTHFSSWAIRPSAWVISHAIDIAQPTAPN
jgi:hypothetical protein